MFTRNGHDWTDRNASLTSASVSSTPNTSGSLGSLETTGSRSGGAIFSWGVAKRTHWYAVAKWEFDVTAYRASDLSNEYVACEVKKTVAELDQLVELIQRFSADRDAGDALKSSKARHASIFWAVGPNRANKVFRMTYTDGGAVIFKSASDEALTYAGA